MTQHSLRSLGTAAVALAAVGAMAQTNLGISSNFNGTSISGDDTVWFNANFNVNGPRNGLELYLRNSTVTLNTGAANQATLNLPDTNVFFQSGATASLTFDELNNAWNLILPDTYTGDMFLNGFAFDVPGSGLSGGVKPVVWTGQLSANRNVSGSWKWGAAVYTDFGANDDLGVVGAKMDPWNSAGHVGTPVNFKDFVIGGARGGGGSNYTGSWSGTQSFQAVPEPGTMAAAGLGALFMAWRRRKRASA